MGKRTSVGCALNAYQIDEYTKTELRDLYDWVASDGKLRTHDEMADEMFAALPFSRRGTRIESVVRDAIQRNEPARHPYKP